MSVENIQAAEVVPTPAVEVPKGSADYANWRLTGKLPDAKPVETPIADGDAELSNSDTAEEAGEKGAPAPEAGKETKNPGKPQPRSTAASRLNELLADLKTAGLSPAELKTFKRETQKPATPIILLPEPPVKQLEKPARPKYADFDGDNDAYETSMEQYEEQLTEWKASEAIEKYKKTEVDKATRNELTTKLAEAQTRYGEEAQTIITTTTGAIVGDAHIPAMLKGMLNESPVLVDLMFVMGQKPEELAAFIAEAKSNPGAAMRKVVLLEKLVLEELAKKPGKAAADDEVVEVVVPGSKKFTKTPEPPEEIGGNKGAVPDEVAEAGKNGDFAKYRRVANVRDLARMKGL